MSSLALALSLVAVPAIAQDPPPTQDPGFVANLTEQNFDAWRDYVASRDDERAWARLPWLPTFHAGLEAAAAADKPLLLWTMNGHPLGCT